MKLSLGATLLLMAIADGRAYGFELMEATALPSGTVYPLLRRLEGRGLVASRWEEESQAAGSGRPRRRYYELSSEGREALGPAMERHGRRLRLFENVAAGAKRP